MGTMTDKTATPNNDLSPDVSIEAIDGVDLRVGKILECEAVEGTDKLVKSVVDLGPFGTRTILSGLRMSYDPEDLVGKHVVVFANLKPRKMRGIESAGMILAAGESPEDLTVTELHRSSRLGDRIG